MKSEKGTKKRCIKMPQVDFTNLRLENFAIITRFEINYWNKSLAREWAQRTHVHLSRTLDNKKCFYTSSSFDTW